MDEINVAEVMGKKLDLSQLSEEECELILKVIQKDFELRQKDKSRIEKAEAELQEEKTKESILLRQKDFNDSFCLRCCGRFIFLLNSKLQCHVCHNNYCKDCCTEDKNTKKLTCTLCTKQLAFEKENGEWFYSSVKNRFKHFGSAKVVRTLYKQKTESDAEYESGTESGSPKKSRADKLSLSQTDSKVLAVQEAIGPSLNAESSKLQLYLTAIASTVQRLYVDSDDTEGIRQQRQLLVSSMDDFKSSLWRAAIKSEALDSMTPPDKDLAIEVLLSQEVAKFLSLEDNILLDDSRSHSEQLADIIVTTAISDKRGSKSSHSGPADGSSEQAATGESALDDSAFADGEPTASENADRDLQGEVAAALVLQEAVNQHHDEAEETAKKHRKQSKRLASSTSEGEGDSGEGNVLVKPDAADEDADLLEVKLEAKAEVTAEELQNAPSAFIVGHNAQHDASENPADALGEESPVIKHHNEDLHYEHPPQQFSVTEEETVTKVLLETDTEDLDSVSASGGDDFVMLDVEGNKQLDDATAAALAAAAIDDETEIIEDKTREGSPEPMHASHPEHIVHTDGAPSPMMENAVDEVRREVVPESLSDHINYSEHDDFAVYYVVATDQDADGRVNVELQADHGEVTPSAENAIDELRPAAVATHEILDHQDNNERDDLAEYDMVAAGREHDRSAFHPPSHHQHSPELQAVENREEELVFTDAASMSHSAPTPSHESRIEINIEPQSVVGDDELPEETVLIDVTPVEVEKSSYEHAPIILLDTHSPQSERNNIDVLDLERESNEETPKDSDALAKFPPLDDTNQSVSHVEFDDSLYDNIPAEELGKKSAAALDEHYRLSASDDNEFELREQLCNTPELLNDEDFLSKPRDVDFDKVSLTTNEGIYEDLMDIVRTNEEGSERGTTKHLPSLADDAATIDASSPASEDVFSLDANDDVKHHTYENLPQAELIIGLPQGTAEGSVLPHTPPSTPANDLEMTFDKAEHEPLYTETFMTEVSASPPHAHKPSGDMVDSETGQEADGGFKPLTFTIPCVAQDRFEDELPHTPVSPVTHSTHQFADFEGVSMARVDDEKFIIAPAEIEVKLAPVENGHDDDKSVFITEIFEMEGKVFFPSMLEPTPAADAVVTDDQVRDLEDKLRFIEHELKSTGHGQEINERINDSIEAPNIDINIGTEKLNGSINSEIDGKKPADNVDFGTEKETKSSVEFVTEVYEMEGKLQIPAAEGGSDRRDKDGDAIHESVGDKNEQLSSEEFLNLSNHFVEISELEGKVFAPQNNYNEQIPVEALLSIDEKVNDNLSAVKQDELFVKIERALSDTVPSPTDDADRRKLDDKRWKSIENDRSISELWKFVENTRSDYWSESPSKADPSVDEFSPLSLLSDEEANELFEPIERSFNDLKAADFSHRTGSKDGKDQDEVVIDVQIKEFRSEVARSVPVWSGFEATHPHSRAPIETHKIVFNVEDPEVSDKEPLRGDDDSKHLNVSHNKQHDSDEEGEIIDVEVRQVHKEVVHSAPPVWPTFESIRRPVESHAIDPQYLPEEDADQSNNEHLPKNGYSAPIASYDSDGGEIVDAQIREVRRKVVHSTPVWPGLEATQQPYAPLKAGEQLKFSEDLLGESNGELLSVHDSASSDNEAVADELHAQLANASGDESSSDENEIVDVQINQTHRPAPVNIAAWPALEPVHPTHSKPIVRLEVEESIADHEINDQQHTGISVPLTVRNDSDTPVNEPVIRKQANIREIVLPELADSDEEEQEPLTNGGQYHDEDADDQLDGIAQPLADTSLLPSFADGQLNDTDLDDFTNNNVNKKTSTDDIMFKSRFKKDIFHEISPYDNFSLRKVGTNERPIYMLVPTSQQAVKIGNRDADDISELDENEVLSDLSDDSEASDSDGRRRSSGKHKKRKATRTKSVTTDSACQTDDLDVSMNNADDRYLADVSLLAAVNDIPAMAEVPADDKLHLSPVAASARTRHDLDDDETESYADPRFTIKPSNVTVAEGELATFTCEIAGTAPADVFWYRDADELKSLESDDRVQVTSSGGRFHQLEMFNVSKSDAGFYLCIAVSAMGKRTKGFQLLVTDNTGEKRTPEILRSLADVEAVCGEDVTFSCKISAYPQPLVRWFKDGKRLQQSEHIHIKKLGNRDYELTLRDVTYNDDAEYMIVVTTIAGVTRSSAQLTVSEATPLPEVVIRENMEVHAAPTPTETTPAPALAPTSSAAPTDPAPALVVTLSPPAAVPAPVSPSALVVTLASPAASPPPANTDLYPPVEKLMEIANMGTELHIQQSAQKAPKVEHQPYDDSATRKLKSSRPRSQRLKSDELSWQPAAPVPREDVSSPDNLEVHSEEDEVELKVSYADSARLYDSGLITLSQLRRGRVRQSDVLPIQAFLDHSTVSSVTQAPLSPPQQRMAPVDHQGQLMLDLPVVELAAADRSPRRADKRMFDRDFIVDDPKSPRTKSSLAVSIPAKPARIIDVHQSPSQQMPLQQHVIMCNIQDSLQFQLQGGADIPASQEVVNVKSPFPDAGGLAEVDVKNLRYKWERLTSNSNEESDSSPDGKRLRAQQTIRSTLQQVRAQQQPRPVSTSSLHINVHKSNSDHRVLSSSSAQVYSSPDATRYQSLPAVYTSPVSSLPPQPQQLQPRLDIRIKPPAHKVHQAVPTQFRNVQNLTPQNDGYRSLPDDHRLQSVRYNGSGKREDMHRNNQEPIQPNRPLIDDSLTSLPNVKDLRMIFGGDSNSGQKPRRKVRRKRKYVASERLNLQMTHVSSSGDSDPPVHSLTARSFTASGSNNRPQNSEFAGQPRRVEYRRLPRS